MHFSNIVNLLTVIPINCYSKFIIPLSNEQKDRIIHEDMDMTAISALIEFLSIRLEYKTNLLENLSPIITSLIRMCKTEKSIRKFIRIQVKLLFT